MLGCESTRGTCSTFIETFNNFVYVCSQCGLCAAAWASVLKIADARLDPCQTDSQHPMVHKLYDVFGRLHGVALPVNCHITQAVHLQTIDCNIDWKMLRDPYDEPVVGWQRVLWSLHSLICSVSQDKGTRNNLAMACSSKIASLLMSGLMCMRPHKFKRQESQRALNSFYLSHVWKVAYIFWLVHMRLSLAYVLMRQEMRLTICLCFQKHPCDDAAAT